VIFVNLFFKTYNPGCVKIGCNMNLIQVKFFFALVKNGIHLIILISAKNNNLLFKGTIL